MKQHYVVAELLKDGESRSLVCFPPTRWRWQAKLALLAYRARQAFSGCAVQAVIVDEERAEYLFVSYGEWVLRNHQTT